MVATGQKSLKLPVKNTHLDFFSLRALIIAFLRDNFLPNTDKSDVGSNDCLSNSLLDVPLRALKVVCMERDMGEGGMVSIIFCAKVSPAFSLFSRGRLAAN